MDKKGDLFYGTPLSRLLEEEQDDNRGDFASSRLRRINRLDKRQTVRDDQGRQRFHGAFTGGYSAGYFNTVSTVEGFKPKQFVSHRSSQISDGNQSSSFSHRPEDYMDDEDLGEFGIAPKKIRLTNQFSANENPLFSGSSVHSLLGPSNQSIGEKILERINSRLNHEHAHDEPLQYPIKADYHGLGYVSLKAKDPTISKAYPISNPLSAVFKDGKRLKISGEAFGAGVLQDEQDDDYLDSSHAYGYDDIRNYDFEKKSSSIKKPSVMKTATTRADDIYDFDCISGFIPAQNNDCANLPGLVNQVTQIPEVPKDWVMPVRSQVTLQDFDRTAKPTMEAKLSFEPKSKSFSGRFTSASDTLRLDDFGAKSGLVQFSDLKAANDRLANEKEKFVEAVVQETLPKAKITVKVEKFEWRPCPLLCKHFNVPNPYPDNAFFGTKPKTAPTVAGTETGHSSVMNLTRHDDHSSKEVFRELASLELRKSIYNIKFPIDLSLAKEMRTAREESEQGDEYEPQVVDLDVTNDCPEQSKKTSLSDDQEEEEIVVLESFKPEPEVIVLSSDSSSSDNDDQPDDTYGPPLPPTLNAINKSNQLGPLNNKLGAKRSSSPRLSKHHKRRKKKKHKRHK